MVMKIGFIGLGIMGAPMAEHLHKAGHHLFLKTRSKMPAWVQGSSAKICESAKAVAQEADIIITMVPDTPDVEAVLFGTDGVGEGISRGKVVVDMSSISPIATKEFAAKIRSLGGDYIDAPVSGGEVGAKNATLTIMVGGDEQVFDRVKPLFELMGKNITLVGENGAGQTTKVANQIIGPSTSRPGRGACFAAKAGADPARVRQALMGGFASSKILEVHGERMVNEHLIQAFASACTRKISTLALSSARALGVSLPNTATAQELFNSLAARGGSGWDHSAMIKALENLANFEIEPPKS
jgi:2-hydroxy-3-oxopropionate reductase